MSRILWLGDAGCTTGFGQVAHGIGDRLVRDYGHDIHVLAVNYDGDYWPTPMKLYLPTKFRQLDLYGLSRFIEMLAEVMPEVVVMVNDPFPIIKHLFRNPFDEQMMMARTAPILGYMPVDGHNQPPVWAKIPEVVSNLTPVQGGGNPSFKPIAMSKYGRTLFPDAPVIYHGIDRSVWRAPSVKDPIIMSNGAKITSKTDARHALSLPEDCFLILRVDRNSTRKNFAETWKAVQPIMRRNRDVHVWFHCKAEGDHLELPQLIVRAPETMDRFHWPGGLDTKHGWPEADLAAVYAAADVFISTALGEGFGLTLAQAASCGVPIIAQDVASITEVVGPGGILIKPGREFTVESGEDQWLPDIEAFTEAIDVLYRSAGRRRDLGEAGIQHVIENFSWDEAARRFDQLIGGTT